jgi:hypothetical protein
MTKKEKVQDIMDLEVSADEGALMEVRHPTTGEVLRHDDGSAFTIKLIGRDSEKFIAVARSQADRRLQQTMRTRAPVLSKVADADEIELLVSATVEWDIILGGKKPESTANNYRDAYKRFRWLREQVDEFVGNRGNFMKG